MVTKHNWNSLDSLALRALNPLTTNVVAKRDLDVASE
jgi:hypothetical protein